MGVEFAWKEPPPEDWEARFVALKAALAGGIAGATEMELRRLGSYRLTPTSEVALGRVAQRVWPVRDGLQQLRPFSLGLAGNRTLAHLGAALPAAGLGRGLLMRGVEFPYDSIAAVVSGAMSLESGDLDAVLLQLDDSALFTSLPLLDDEAEGRAVRQALDHLETTVDGLRRRFRAPVLVATVVSALPIAIGSIDGATAGSRVRLIERLNAEVREHARLGRWLLWDLAALAAEVGFSRWRDASRFYTAKMPFAPALAPVAADSLSRMVAAMTGKSGRALILDLDDTLWGGVIGDDGVEGLRLGQGDPEGEAFQAFQSVVLELHRRGVVLAVCSKNTDEVARRAFRTHPEMLLREDHIAVFQANWEDKVANIRAIAQCLRLGEENLVFVDDNPAERARVRQEMPLIKVPEMGCDPALYPELLLGSGFFEHLVLGRDDLLRSQSYRPMTQAAIESRNFEDYDGFLAGLEMRMDIRPFDDIGRNRITQLINKSNQFNLTTRRYNEVEVAAIAADPSALAWQARLSDRFGDHGMIAVVIVRCGDVEWEIDSWLQSCRVLKRGVEQALMTELFAVAGEVGVERIVGRFIPTSRNGLVRRFYDDFGFTPVATEHGGTVRYEAATAKWRPMRTFVAVSHAGS